MKKLTAFIIIILFVSGCHQPHKLIRNDRLFTRVDSTHKFKDNNLYLQTADKRYHLVNPVIENGKIKAEIVKESYQEKNLILIYQKKYGEVAEPIMDSAGNPTNFIQLSSKHITRVDLYNRKVKFFKRKRVYHPHPYRFMLGRILMYIGIVYVVLGFITIFSMFTLILVQGCYIATMVYGSYDAPEVLVLREYRDEKLAPYFFGRVFIRIYYTLSPVFVHLFKNNKAVNQFIKSILDKWVINLMKARSEAQASSSC